MRFIIVEMRRLNYDRAARTAKYSDVCAELSAAEERVIAFARTVHPHQHHHCDHFDHPRDHHFIHCVCSSDCNELRAQHFLSLSLYPFLSSLNSYF